jgi:hypothetical protein
MGDGDHNNRQGTDIDLPGHAIGRLLPFRLPLLLRRGFFRRKRLSVRCARHSSIALRL